MSQMRHITYFGRVKEDASLHIIHRNDFDNDIKAWTGKDVIIKVSLKYRKRSLNQSAYYWAVVVQMIRERLIELWGEKGISREQIHEMLKLQCNKLEMYDENTGVVIVLAGDTKSLTTVEFMEYIEKCRQWAYLELDLEIPEPSEQTMLNFEEE